MGLLSLLFFLISLYYRINFLTSLLLFYLIPSLILSYYHRKYIVLSLLISLLMLPVFTLIDLDNLWMAACVNESDVGKIKLNQRAYVMTDSYPNKRYDGWVSFISEQTDLAPRYIKVRVDNSSLDLKPGMAADAYIMVGDRRSWKDM